MRRKLVLLAVASVVIYCSCIGLLYFDGQSDSVPHAAVAVVYGNTVHPNGELSNRLKARVDAALYLYQQHKVAAIFVSGGVGKEGHDEAEKMAEYLMANEVPEEDVIVDSDGVTTSATSKHAFAVLGDVPVVAVTQQFHLARAKHSLRNAGFGTVYGYHPSFFEWRDIYSALREVPAFVKYWWLHL